MRVPLAIWLLGFVSLFMDVSSEIVNSLLPLYLVGTMGASVAVVGFVEAFGNATATVTRLLSGFWSDRHASRKGLTLAGYGLAAASKPLIPLTGTLAGITASRFLDRLGKGLRSAPRDAMVADLAPAAIRGKAFGLRKGLDTVGGFAGPLLAVWLMFVFTNDIVAVFWVATIPAIVSVAVLAFGVREPPRSTPIRATRVTWRMAIALTPPVWRAIGLTGIIGLARFSEAFLLLRAADVALPTTLVPLVIAVLHAVYGLASFPAGWLSDRVGRRPLLVAGLAVLVLAHATLGIATSPGLLWLGIGLWGLHMGLTQGVLSAIVADVAPDHLRGSAFAVLAVASGIAMATANLVAGAAWHWWGAPATFATAGGAAAVALLLVAIQKPMTDAG